MKKEKMDGRMDGRTDGWIEKWRGSFPPRLGSVPHTVALAYIHPSR